MIRLDPDALRRWRAEVDLGVEFREKEFGTYRQSAPGSAPQTTGAGKNLEAFESGARLEDTTPLPPVNLVFPIVKTIVPTMFFQHPRAMAQPESRHEEAAEDAFYVAELLNRDLKSPDLRVKATGQQATFDAFVLGCGMVKVGYATEFGPDILPTKQETRQRFRDRVKQQVNQALETIGLRPPRQEDPEPEAVQSDLTITAESPYIAWVSPFDIAIDPRARDLTDARWIAQRIRRTVAEIKRDRRYSRERFDLHADPLDEEGIPDSYVEEFQTADVWEVHYKDPESPTGITVLTFAATQTDTKALMHEHNPYDLGGWQYEWVTPNKHGHRLWPVSTLSIARPLIERANSAFDAILEQVDKFQDKLAYNERVTKEGQYALQSPALGALVKLTGDGDVRGAIASVSMQQLNTEVVRFLDYVTDLIILITGLTRAQLTGLTTAQTATEAQIGQSGQNLRRTDEANLIADWINRVVTKLWRVKAQFQDLTSLDLPQESALVNPQNGMSQTQWYPPIDAARAQRLKTQKFRFAIEVGSIQKPSLEVIRAQFEQFARALMEPVVTQGLALEGKRLSASEVIRQWTKFFEEYGLPGVINKLIIPVTSPQEQQALLGYGQKPSAVNGNGQPQVPNRADLISRAAGEKGQGVPGA